MWLSVLVPEKGLTCIELANDDATISHVKNCLGSILHRDTADYDLFMGAQLLEDSAMLSDFDLTDSCDYVTLVDRASALASRCASRRHTSQFDLCEPSALRPPQTDIVTSTLSRHSALADDPIEPPSPSMSELDPVEFTPREHSTISTRKPIARQRVKRKAAIEGKEVGNERFGFPKWECQRK
jgi:hypothetical protein